MKQLYTRWGREIDSSHILQEYPRPLLQRESCINLNGYWDYAITKKYCKPRTYDGKILVPFSPESTLSGVNRQLQPYEYLWYRTFLPVEAEKLQSGFRLVLHFGAVDQACRVYINGREVMRHAGGYLPFSADITEFCRQKMTNPTALSAANQTQNVKLPVCNDDAMPLPVTSGPELVLAVRDLSDTSYHAKGKQKLKRGGMFYTAQSGIWQTVWMEYVPECYIEEIVTEPDLNCGAVRVLVRSSAALPIMIQVKEPALYQAAQPSASTPGISSAEEDVPKTSQRKADSSPTALPPQESDSSTPKLTHEKTLAHAGRIIAECTGRSNREIEISLPIIRPWTCDEPYLYYFTVTMGNDTVESYFALRSFTVEPDQDGIPRICLNGQVQFQNGVLDQGYWPDGLYTAPADEAYIFDISEMKKMGFNMIRKHIKIEPQRWYYHCDRLGMVVWQDMVNGGSYYKHWFVTYAATLFSRSRWRIPDTCLHLLSRTHKEGRKEFVREMKETIRILKGHPCIAVWVIFNEGWGQFHAGEITRIARKCDGSRLIDQASGWFDQNGGDLQSIHHYFFKCKFKPEQKRATVLSEFGGYSLQIPEHSSYEKLYGYGIFKNALALKNAYEARMNKVYGQISEGLCASVYTQLSDVEEEVNGIFTYDREINKFL